MRGYAWNAADQCLQRLDSCSISRDGELRICYEASGAGYVLHRAIQEWGHACEVIADMTRKTSVNPTSKIVASPGPPSDTPPAGVTNNATTEANPVSAIHQATKNGRVRWRRYESRVGWFTFGVEKRSEVCNGGESHLLM